MLKKPVSLVLSVIIIMVFFAACSGRDGSNADLVFPAAGEPRSLDPQISDPAADIVTANCFEGLVRAGEQGTILPGVAKEWTVSGDGLTYTFRLRTDAKWHLIDGYESILGKDFRHTFNTAVTARDFVFGLRRAVMPQTSSPYATSLFAIQNAQAVNAGSLSPTQLGVAAPDDYTLIITLTAGSADFLNLLATPVCMPCSEAFFNAAKGKYGLDDDFLLCNGPFYLSVWNQGTSLTLRKNKDYAGNSAVYPNSVTIKIAPDTAQYAQKVIQSFYSAAPVTMVQAALFDSADGITLNEYPNITAALCFNCSDTPLSNTSVRLALCRAIDKSALVSAFNGQEFTDRLVPACCTVGQTAFTGLATNIKPLTLDADSAKKNWDTGLEQLGVQQIVLTVICEAKYETAMRGMLQSWQKILGISLSASIEPLDPAELQKRVADGNYQIAFAPVQARKSSAAGFLNSFESGNTDNILHYSSEVYDGLLRQISLAGSTEETARLCGEAQNHLLQNGAVYPFFSQSSCFAMAEGVSGIYISPAGERVFFIRGKAVK